MVSLSELHSRLFKSEPNPSTGGGSIDTERKVEIISTEIDKILKYITDKKNNGQSISLDDEYTKRGNIPITLSQAIVALAEMINSLRVTENDPDPFAQASLNIIKSNNLEKIDKIKELLISNDPDLTQIINANKALETARVFVAKKYIELVIKTDNLLSNTSKKLNDLVKQKLLDIKTKLESRLLDEAPKKINTFDAFYDTLNNTNTFNSTEWDDLIADIEASAANFGKYGKAGFKELLKRVKASKNEKEAEAKRIADAEAERLASRTTNETRSIEIKSLEEAKEFLRNNIVLNCLDTLIGLAAKQGGADGGVALDSITTTSASPKLIEALANFDAQKDALDLAIGFFEKNKDSDEYKQALAILRLSDTRQNHWNYMFVNREIRADKQGGVVHQLSHMPNKFDIEQINGIDSFYKTIEKLDKKKIMNGDYFRLKRIVIWLESAFKIKLDGENESDNQMSLVDNDDKDKLLKYFAYGNYASRKDTLWKVSYVLLALELKLISNDAYKEIVKFSLNPEFGPDDKTKYLVDIDTLKYNNLIDVIFVNYYRSKKGITDHSIVSEDVCKQETRSLLDVMKEQIVYGGLQDEVYCVLQLIGKSPQHDSTKLGTKSQPFYELISNFSSATYKVINPPVPFAEAMQVGLYSEKSIYDLYNRFDRLKKYKPDQKLLKFRKLVRLYFSCFFRKKDLPEFDATTIFPDFMTGMKVHNTGVKDYFGTALKGKMYLVDELLTQLFYNGEKRMSSEDLVAQISDYLKQGPGLDKVGKDCSDGKEMMNRISFTIMWYFQQLAENSSTLFLQRANPIYDFLTTESNLLRNGLKKFLLDKATTLSYLGTSPKELFHDVSGNFREDVWNKYDIAIKEYGSDKIEPFIIKYIILEIVLGIRTKFKKDKHNDIVMVEDRGFVSKIGVIYDVFVGMNKKSSLIPPGLKLIRRKDAYRKYIEEHSEFYQSEPLGWIEWLREKKELALSTSLELASKIEVPILKKYRKKFLG